jgi:hypothetical protein
MSIREACRPAVIAPLRGLSTNAQPDRKDARWLGGYLTSSALMLGATELLTLSVLTGNLRAATIVRRTLGLLPVCPHDPGPALPPPGAIRDRLAVGAP